MKVPRFDSAPLGQVMPTTRGCLLQASFVAAVLLPVGVLTAAPESRSSVFLSKACTCCAPEATAP